MVFVLTSSLPSIIANLTSKPTYERGLLDNLLESEKREQLKKVWTEPEALNPHARREEKTLGSFKQLERVTDILKGCLAYPADKAAYFLIKVVFTLFAEDEGLIPVKTFERIGRGYCTGSPFPRADAAISQAS